MQRSHDRNQEGATSPASRTFGHRPWTERIVDGCTTRVLPVALNELKINLPFGSNFRVSQKAVGRKRIPVDSVEQAIPPRLLIPRYLISLLSHWPYIIVRRSA